MHCDRSPLKPYKKENEEMHILNMDLECERNIETILTKITQ